MKLILILVEGQTEERFVKDLLVPHFDTLELRLTPTIVRTGKDTSGSSNKGGYLSFAKLARQVRNLLGNSAAAVVTTMLDYYGLPSDFPGLDAKKGHASEHVLHLEQCFHEELHRDGRFIPYLSLHELEALFLAAPDVIAEGMRQPDSVQILERAMGGRRPEEVNDGPETHPSKLITTTFRRYGKIKDGIRIAKRIGLEKMRAECPHFDGWLRHLEALAPGASSGAGT